jgi:hypothetical protein
VLIDAGEQQFADGGFGHGFVVKVPSIARW